MRLAPAIAVLLSGLGCAACGSSTPNKDAAQEGDAGLGEGGQTTAVPGAEENGSTDCGDVRPCAADQLCVTTRGARCMPLPDPGEMCEQGCVLTEHCCNCPAFACVPLPEECVDGATCGCVEDAQGNGFFETGCPRERSSCDDGEGTVLTCILVDFDEDPFAE